VEWYYRTVAKYLAVPKGQAPIRSYELYSQSQHAAETLGFGELAASPRMVCGDVDHCVQKLTSVIQEYGFNELLYWPCIGGIAVTLSGPPSTPRTCLPRSRGPGQSGERGF
jgi:hypothetical protein